jgi:cytoskeletal protein CcmA (bactofilin family)
MSRRFLTNIDLEGNQLLNGVIHNLVEDPETGKAGQVYYNTTDQVLKIYNGDAEEWQAVGSEEYIGDAVANLIQSGEGISVDYDDEGNSLTIANTGVLSVAGTDNEITVSASAGDVTIGLPEDVRIQSSLVVRPASMEDPTNVLNASEGGVVIGKLLEARENVSLYKDLLVSGSTYLTGKVETEEDVNIGGDLIVSEFTNLQDNVQIDGELSVGASAYFADNVEVQGDMTIHGDLNVDGTLNAINRTEINLEDNTIRLNSNLGASATPISDAGLIVERGAEENAALRWNETLDQWEIGFEDGTYQAIIATNDLTEDVEDIVGNLVVGSNSLSVIYDDEENELLLDTVLQSSSPSYLLNANGLAVDIPTLETQLITDSFTRKAAANVGNGTNVSFALIHGFNTRDVVVNVYDNATYDTVEVDVVRTDADTVTVTFAEAPSASAYRVVIIG